MKNVLALSQPPYAPISCEVRPSNGVILKSGATRMPLCTRSIVIGPPVCPASADARTADPDGASDKEVDASCPLAAAGARDATRAARRRHLPLILAPQADIQRRGVAAAHLNFGDVGAIASLLNLHGVTSFSNLRSEERRVGKEVRSRV